MAERASSSEHGAHTEHVVPVSTYIIVFICLLLLTGLTTGAANLNLGGR